LVTGRVGTNLMSKEGNKEDAEPKQ
jgi:hypothetical protein